MSYNTTLIIQKNSQHNIILEIQLFIIITVFPDFLNVSIDECKKIFLSVEPKVAPKVYLCSNLCNETHILLSEDVFKLYDADNLEQIKQIYPQVYERLEKENFLYLRMLMNL